MATLRDDQIRRYARHVLLPDVGGRGQERFLAASVAIELGPDRHAEVVALAYLSAAGVGTIALLGDAAGPLGEAEVAAGILYGAADLGRPRIEAVRERVNALNPDVTVVAGHPAQHELASELGPARAGSGSDPESIIADALVRGGAAATRLLDRLARPG
jgi:molybdopterin/thiamine biosynthesis adenylyltransferase